MNFPAVEHRMIYIYHNFISIFQQMNTWWYIYIPQLYINFPADEHVMIYTYATLYQLSCAWTPDDIYIPELYINFSADEYLMICTYRNLISIFLQLYSWEYIHTATLCQFFSRWTRDDIYIFQLYFNFPADQHLMIYIHTATLYQLSCR